jgi:hypothetical protein
MGCSRSTVRIAALIAGASARGVARGPNADVHPQLRRLGEGDIDCAARFAVVGVVHDVAGDAHDGQPWGLGIGAAQADVLADGRFVFPPAFGHALADHRDLGCVGSVGVGQPAACYQWNVHQIEVLRRGHLIHPVRELAGFDRPAFDGEASSVGMIAVGKGRDGGRAAYAGKYADAVEHVAVVGNTLVGFMIFVVGERQAHGEQTGRLEAFAVFDELAKSADHQPRTHEQDHRQRYLGCDQDVAQAMARAAGRASPAAFLEGVSEIGTGALPRRREAGEDAAQDRCDQGKHQRAAIQLNVLPAEDVAFDFGGHAAPDQTHSPSANQQAEQRAGYGEEHAFGD